MLMVHTGKRLKELRTGRKISGYKMAEKLGISPQYYYEIERGEKRLNEDLIKRVSDILSVSADYLLGVNDSKDDSVIDVKDLLDDNQFKKFHWDGEPLDDEAIRETKELIEYVLWKRTQKKK